MEFAAS